MFALVLKFSPKVFVPGKKIASVPEKLYMFLAKDYANTPTDHAEF